MTPRLVVEREAEVVTLTITCESAYAAIELYELVCEGAAEGHIELETSE